MPRITTPSIPPKMYRHFAIVTVLLTAGLAMFANGENREAVAAHFESRAEENELRRESYAKFGAPKVGENEDARPRTPHGWNDGNDGDFGRPMERMRRDTSSSVFPGSEMADAVEAAGYSPEYLATLSPEERELLLKGLEESGMLSEETRETRSRELAAASRRRSGAPAGND